MWITKNGIAKDFYDPEDLRAFLDGLSLAESSTLTPHRDMMATDQSTSLHDLAPGGTGSEHLLSPAPGGETWRDSFTATTIGDRCRMRWRAVHKWRIEAYRAPL
ncbi:hypothetical protein NDU88_006165 [Pleurodeles waltl]|uniref:Uncharacterized protein n=1 Tax=Pleurodeles waltl TaxID=8319 RepID=A0AAV7TD37_PLEWA|nr:hypothetical protein NDU88_006165 [Pleurodeles waltl]